MITVLIIIWVTVACTPIKPPQSDLSEVATLTDLPTQESVTSTVDQTTSTATETKVSTPTQTATETKTPTPTAESLIQGTFSRIPPNPKRNLTLWYWLPLPLTTRKISPAFRLNI